MYVRKVIIMLNKTIGVNIRQFRADKGLSQEDLASILFVTRQTVSNYETGRSFPDIDMLNNISAALDVELLWLLYGKPIPIDKIAKRKATLILIGSFSGLLILTMALCTYTLNLRLRYMNVMPNILTRLILVPLTMAFLGVIMLQVMDYFLDIKKPKKDPQKIGRILTICVIGFNLTIVFPYIIWCFSSLFQKLLGSNSIHMIFPRIPLYEEVAHFFLLLMYSFPFVYIFVGMALWLFYSPKARI